MSTHLSLKPSPHSYKWLGDFAPVVLAFNEYLERHGYARSVVLRYLGGAAHFLYWLKARRGGVADIDESLVGIFVARHLPHCCCPKRRGLGLTRVEFALDRLLEVLRERSWIPARVPPLEGTLEAELREFEHYLIEVCGMMVSSRQAHLQKVRRFLSECFGAQRVDITDLTPDDIRSFFKRHGPQWQPVSMIPVQAALRGYLRFKSIHGVSVQRLGAAIPQRPRWRLAGLPKALTPAEVERFLSAFDRSCPTGRRDYAIARCLADLGLRAVEVSRLQLEDIAWGEATLAIRSKGRRVDLLPLPRTLGLALAQYLRHGRPNSACRAMFLPRRAPRDQPMTSIAIRGCMRYAAQRCGLQGRYTGTHLLRHTVATRLVQRGASLKVIADLLRHRSLNTTTIYAKVDLPALARVAMPWPGAKP
jgi:integrase/recombinase XerD